MNQPQHRSNSVEARDINSVIHGATNLKRHLEQGPLVIDKGEGVWVTDIHGARYIEGMSGLWCVSLGYGQERLVATCANQMSKLPYGHLIDHRGHSPVVELAEKLLSIAPVLMARVWFSNSGSEGIDCAARMAWYYWNAEGQPGAAKIHRPSASLSWKYDRVGEFDGRERLPSLFQPAARRIFACSLPTFLSRRDIPASARSSSHPG